MTLVALIAGWATLGAPAITFEAADLTVPEPSIVRLELAATGAGVEVGSYGVRTRDEGVALPGLVPRGKYAFVPAAPRDDDLWYFFLDDRRGDLDVEAGRVALQIDVSEWPDGEHRFTVFACNRPAEGRYVQDTRTLRVETRDGNAVLPGTCLLESLNVAIASFSVEPPRADAGEQVAVRASYEARGAGDLVWTLTVPYWVEEHETAPGWHYDAEAQKAFLTAEPFADNGPPDLDPEPGALELGIDTAGWPPGVHNFTLQAAAAFAPAQVLVYRDFAITVRPEQPRFDVEFEDDQGLREGTHFDVEFEDDQALREGVHFDNIISPAEGVAFAYDRVTRDGGRTWQKLERGAIPSLNVPANGAVVGMSMRSKPIEGRPGYYKITLFESEDGGDTFAPVGAELHVPEATSGVGHAFAAGPILFRSIVQMPDGALLATFYGWFEGDESPVPGQKGSFRIRTWLMRSDDRGRHWEYHATIAYDAEIGTDGYCEPVMKLLPDGSLICLLRTGGNNRPYHLDNPLMVAWSEDGGLTWTEPVRTGFEGVAPDLVVMNDGTLACSTGRPGAWLLLSADNGHTWSDAFSINAERYSGYTGLCEVEPGVLLIGYGARDWLNPETGERQDSLRTVRARVRRLP